MNPAIWTAAALACAASVAVVARDDYKGITVTGCVQNFSSADTSGVTERGFLLSNPTLVQPDGAPFPTPTTGMTAAGTATGTSGTAAPGMPTSGTWAATSGTITTAAAKARSLYRLDGDDEELKAQVGHKVEISGSIEPKPDNALKSVPERLHVSKITMLASECSK